MHRQTDRAFWSDVLAVAFGSLMTLCVSGYQFGRGNHTVYLLEGLRIARPELLQNDWFVTSTLQYHAMFSWMTATLMKLHLLEPGFLAGYLLIVLLWQIAWLRFTQLLGGTTFTYAVSVLLYYLSAAGIGLGVYQFLQDGCFLPSNVASVALLWGLYWWVMRRPLAAGVCFGLAGLFHLNYAMAGVGTWTALVTWDWLEDLRPSRRGDRASRRSKPFWRPSLIVGSIIVLAPSMLNVALALQIKLRESGSIPLDRFVEVYVHFRHTHHFDPLHWPIALWVSFLWPIPIALWAWSRRYKQTGAATAERDILRQTGRIFVLMLGLQVIAFVFAGIWFVSESLVQLILWRFSVYVKLLACIGAAYALHDARLLKPAALRVLLFAIAGILAAMIVLLFAGVTGNPSPTTDLATNAVREHLPAFALFLALAIALALASLRVRPLGRAAAIGLTCCLVAVMALGWKQRALGWGMTPEEVDPDYLNLCHWARDNTPVDAVFLVPPQETAFRLEAQRAIVINFKHVPQLSGELMIWLGRLEDVLGTTDLEHFPHGYQQTMRALDERYAARRPEDLLAIARKYGARYVVVSHQWGPDYQNMLVRAENDHYFVYDRAAP